MSQNNEVRIIFIYENIFSKQFGDKQPDKENTFIIVFLTSCFVLHQPSKSQKTTYLGNLFQRHQHIKIDETRWILFGVVSEKSLRFSEV